jgi:subtilisin family serine protease
LDINATISFDDECVDQVWSYDGAWHSHESLLAKGSGFWIKANQKCNLPAFTEPLQSKQWSIFDTNASINLKSYYGKYSGKGVKVAIIDDSIDISHEDLPDMSSYKVANIKSYHYHGTAVTGIISAQINNKGILGIAPDAEILFIMMKSHNTNSEYIELFEYARTWGADVINCSWGTYDVSESVKEKIISMDIPIVFATGNDNKDIASDESGIKEVISVGATNDSNNRAYYSNYGNEIDILAPGGLASNGIATLDPMGSNGRSDDNYIGQSDIYTFAGTSASAPIVTAVIALMLEANPNLSREDIEYILQQTATKIGYLEYDENGHNIYYGYGKLHADKAIDMAQSYVSSRSVLNFVNNNVVEYNLTNIKSEDLNQTKKVDFR